MNGSRLWKNVWSELEGGVALLSQRQLNEEAGRGRLYIQETQEVYWPLYYANPDPYARPRIRSQGWVRRGKFRDWAIGVKVVEVVVEGQMLARWPIWCTWLPR